MSVTYAMIASLDTEALAQAMLRALPRMSKGDPDRLKCKVAARVREHGITGRSIAEMLCATRETPLDKNDTFIKLFDGTDEDFVHATTNVRNRKLFAKQMFLKLFLSETCPVVADAQQRIFNPQLIPEGCRLPEYDAVYPDGDLFVIKFGQEVLHTYDSEIGRKGEGKRGMHGVYVSPGGWLRLALKSSEAVDWSTWHKAYHGTRVTNVRSIADKGLVRPAKSQHGAAGAGGKMVVYCSPSIEYAAHHLYTGSDMSAGALSERPLPLGSTDSGSSTVGSVLRESRHQYDLDELEKDGLYAQYVFEVMVKPDGYRVQGNTLGKGLWESRDIEYDTLSSSRNLEWIVEDEEDIAVTGVMLRALPQKPKEYMAERMERMKRHVGWNATTQRATRPRADGGVGPGVEAAWEYNGNARETLRRDDGCDWKRYPDQISDLIEAAYQDYQRIAFLGELAPGQPYYIDFGTWCEDPAPGEGGPAPPDGPEQRRADGNRTEAWKRRAVRRVRKHRGWGLFSW